MKKLILSFFLIVSGLIAKAQVFCIINDKDGFINVRKSPGVNSPIVGKLYTDQIFAYYDDTDDKSSWLQIALRNENNVDILNGYVSRNRILELQSFKKINKLKFYKDSCVASNDSILIAIKSTPFNPKGHQLQFSKPGKNERASLMKIDKKTVWGVDGDIPKKDISSLKIIKHGVPIIVPKSAYRDLHEPNFYSDNVNVYLNNNTIYIQMNNSDGAGGYSVVWTIKDNKYYGRYRKKQWRPN